MPKGQVKKPTLINLFHRSPTHVFFGTHWRVDNGKTFYKQFEIFFNRPRKRNENEVGAISQKKQHKT